jgi:hypothetical protein
MNANKDIHFIAVETIVTVACPKMSEARIAALRAEMESINRAHTLFSKTELERESGSQGRMSATTGSASGESVRNCQ